MQASTSWDDVAFSLTEGDRHPGIRPVSQLNTWPVVSPVNASRLPSRAVSKSAAAFSGYRQANLRFAPAINFPASPSDQPPTCVGDLSPALPSNSTTDPHRPSDPSTCLQIALQLALATNLPACLPASLRLASSANFPAQPLHRPATCAACRSSGLPSDSSPACAFNSSSSSTFQPTSSLRLRSAFRFRLRT